MNNSMKIVLFIVLSTVFCFCSYASDDNLRSFDTTHFKINLPNHLKLIPPGEIPSTHGKKSQASTFIEPKKERDNSILLVLLFEKSNRTQQADLEAMAKVLLLTAYSDPDSERCDMNLTETRFADQKGYYFQRDIRRPIPSTNAYWMTIHGNTFVTARLLVPPQGDKTLAETIEKGILSMKLKNPE
jgi:hypothetical protein